MARLSRADLRHRSVEELIDLPLDQRPLTNRGNPPGKATWRQMIKAEHSKANRESGPIQLESGPLLDPDEKPAKSDTDTPVKSAYLSADRLKRIAAAEKMAKTFNVNPTTIANNLDGAHQIVALLMREPAIKLQDRAEADAMGKAIYDVLIQYDLVWVFQHTPLLLLATTVGTVEFNTVARVRAARAARNQPRVVTAPPPAHNPPSAPANGAGRVRASNEPLPPDPPFAATTPDEPSFAQRIAEHNRQLSQADNDVNVAETPNVEESANNE